MVRKIGLALALTVVLSLSGCYLKAEWGKGGQVAAPTDQVDSDTDPDK